MSILGLNTPCYCFPRLHPLQVQQALQEAARGRSVVVIAHRLSTVSGADLVAVVQQGQIRESGTHASLMTAGGAYSQLVQRQVFTGGSEGPLLGQVEVGQVEEGPAKCPRQPEAAEAVAGAVGVGTEEGSAPVLTDAAVTEVLPTPVAAVVAATGAHTATSSSSVDAGMTSAATPVHAAAAESGAGPKDAAGATDAVADMSARAGSRSAEGARNAAPPPAVATAAAPMPAVDSSAAAGASSGVDNSASSGPSTAAGSSGSGGAAAGTTAAAGSAGGGRGKKGSKGRKKR